MLINTTTRGRRFGHRLFLDYNVFNTVTLFVQRIFGL